LQRSHLVACRCGTPLLWIADGTSTYRDGEHVQVVTKALAVALGADNDGNYDQHLNCRVS
jgi:hypothetical protein